ncbi:MAG: hypothetical protein H7249_13085 [Chitinophagaceae bacterium]|nr:hypothetical protein [Oligoflexus sp.]
MDKKTGIGLGVLALCVGIFVSKKKFAVDANKPDQVSQLVIQAPIKQEIIEARTDPRSHEAIARERQTYSLQLMTGLKQIDAKKSGSTLTFRFGPKSEAVYCLLGDFDFIKGSVNSLTADVMLISIEPLTGDSSKAIRYRVSMKDIAEGKVFNAQLPVESKSKDYGVYLCTDYQKTNVCSSKKLLSSNEWNTAIRSEKELDRVLYYQMLTVAKENVYLIPSKNWDTKSIDNLKARLAPIIQSPESIDLLKKNIEQLQSVPARVTKDLLELLLPHKASNC